MKNINEVLAAVIDGVKDITGIFGVDSTGRRVKKFRDNPNGADDDLFFDVTGVHLFHFFANAAIKFEQEKANLWTEIATRAGDATIPAPKNLAIDRSLGEIALYVFAQLDKRAGDANNAGNGNDGNGNDGNNGGNGGDA